MRSVRELFWLAPEQADDHQRSQQKDGGCLHHQVTCRRGENTPGTLSRGRFLAVGFGGLVGLYAALHLKDIFFQQTKARRIWLPLICHLESSTPYGAAKTSP